MRGHDGDDGHDGGDDRVSLLSQVKSRLKLEETCVTERVAAVLTEAVSEAVEEEVDVAITVYYLSDAVNKCVQQRGNRIQGLWRRLCDLLVWRRGTSVRCQVRVLSFLSSCAALLFFLLLLLLLFLLLLPSLSLSLAITRILTISLLSSSLFSLSLHLLTYPLAINAGALYPPSPPRGSHRETRGRAPYRYADASIACYGRRGN